MWEPVFLKALTQAVCLYCQEIVYIKPGVRPRRLEILLRIAANDRVQLPLQCLQEAKQQGWMHLLEQAIINRLFEVLKEHATESEEAIYHINVSGNTLAKLSDWGWLYRNFENSHLTPKNICLEIVESEAISAQAIEQCLNLRKMGMLIAIDDFGAGQISFEQIERLRPDIVKLDGQFVKRAPFNRFAAEVLIGTCRAVRALGAEVVAECVENQLILDYVKTQDFDYAQGWFFGKPAPLLAEKYNLKHAKNGIEKGICNHDDQCSGAIRSYC